MIWLLVQACLQGRNEPVIVLEEYQSLIILHINVNWHLGFQINFVSLVRVSPAHNDSVLCMLIKPVSELEKLKARRR